MELMYAAALRFDLHVPESRSLKCKRAAIRPIVDGLRHRFRLSVAEDQDRWQRAVIGVAVVAESARRLDEIIEAVERFVARAAAVELVDMSRLELVDDAFPLAEDA